MTDLDLIERITRSLAYMLRHQPQEFDLELDRFGYADADEVVRALNERLGETVTREDLEGAITSGDRPRYEIRGSQVRALYGHSIPVEPGEPSKPPEVLYVGLSLRDAERATQHGLSGGRRRFLHLARTIEDARESGRRAGREYAVLAVRAVDAWEEGINFYDRTALFLSESLPTRFITVHERYSDGDENARTGDFRRDTPREFHDSRPRRDEFRGREPRGGGDSRERDSFVPARAPDSAPFAPQGGESRDDRPRRRRRGGRGRQDRDRDRSERPAPVGDSFGRDDRGHEPRNEPRSEPAFEARRPEPRHDDRPQFDRGNRGDRGGRFERPSRDSRPPEPRRDEPRRDEFRRDAPRRDDFRRDEPRRDDRPQRAPESRPAPAPAPRPTEPARAASSDDGGFGLGVFEAKREAPAPRPQVEERRPEPPRPAPVETPKEPDSDDSFGAGL